MAYNGGDLKIEQFRLIPWEVEHYKINIMRDPVETDSERMRCVENT